MFPLAVKEVKRRLLMLVTPRVLTKAEANSQKEPP
jgi:hypothetical protein